MATKTVAAGGGNFNVGSTWVGGVAPVAGDDIVANASSGNLTLATTNTVSLTGANFTGYTGTLAFGSFQMIFNTAGVFNITLSSGMTITYTTGYFNIQRQGTITSPATAKIIPVRFQGTFTITLVNDLHAQFFNIFTANTTYIGANVVFYNTFVNASAANITINSPYKMIWRPSSSAVSSNGLQPTGPAFVPPKGHFIFDSQYTVCIASGLELNGLHTASASSIFEFSTTQSAVGFTGNGSFNFVDQRGRLLAGINVANGGSCSIITNGVRFSDIEVYGENPFFANCAVYFHTGLETDRFTIGKLDYLGGNTTNKSSTVSIAGAGFFTASRVHMSTSLPIGFAPSSFTSFPAYGAAQPFTQSAAMLNLALSPTFSYSFGTISITCIPEKKLNLSSTVDSTPATISVTNGFITNANITDIENTGTTVLAYSSMGNTLTRTSGFTGTEPSGGGGESSYTFVN